jgi:branched-chain amino acid transport system ATP-binding protein
MSLPKAIDKRFAPIPKSTISISGRSEQVLVLSDIHTYYGDSYVLQGISLTVDPGKVVALLGRNGVGKTTLIRSVMGLTPPRRGNVLMNGTDITHWAPYRVARRGIGLVPQGRRVFSSLTVNENIDVAARQGSHGARWDLPRILDLFPHLRERQGHSAATLSGGEQQMLAAGRALVGNPELMLMDEPCEGLAPLMVRELGRVIDALKQTGTSILLIEQQVGFAMRHADIIHIMAKGKIVHSCTPTDLATNNEIKSRYLSL